MMKRLLQGIALLVLLPTITMAQQRKSAPKAALDAGQSCAILPSAPWMKRQAEWFDDAAHSWTNDTLRSALLSAAAITSPLTPPVQTGVQLAGQERKLGAGADSLIQQLKKLASTRGSAWPTKSVVGAAGAHAVYLLADSDTGLARAVLHRLMEAGPAESPAADVATLEDKLRVLSGRKQLYGTQFRLEGGRVVLAPMEDSSHADLRREDAGLPPFALGLCLARNARY